MPPGSARAFEPRRDVDPIAKDVVVLDDDIAEIDADAQFDAIVRRRSAHCARPSRCCTAIAQRNASTTLANSTSNPSPVVLTMRPRCSAIFGSISSRRSALSVERSFLVRPHQPRIARHIGGQDRGEAAGLAHAASPAARRRPDRKSSRCSGFRRIASVRYHDRGDGAQPRDDLSRVIEPSHMRVAGGEKAIRVREVRIVLDREEQLRHCLVEAPAEEMRVRQSQLATCRCGRAG